MEDEATRHLVDRFRAALCAALPLVSLWAHGSLAGGDYRPGRSDLDLVAVVRRRCPADEEQRLRALHERLAQDTPLAAKLHCGYLPAAEFGDPGAAHLAWAHEELGHRPVTEVARRELHEFGLVLHGPPPAGLLPPVTDEQLSAFVIDDLAHFWLSALDHPERWLRDVWVDLGLLALTRARVTLETGRLITKGEALDVLSARGAPAALVDDIRQRRYGDPKPPSERWLRERAALALAYLRPALREVVADFAA